MFYCEPCAKKNHWPTTIMVKSYGRCEVCGKTRECNDTPSSVLSSSPERRKHHVAHDVGTPAVVEIKGAYLPCPMCFEPLVILSADKVTQPFTFAVTDPTNGRPPPSGHEAWITPHAKTCSLVTR